MLNVKRYVLIVLMVMAFLPTVVSYYPVQATAMANVTASSNFSIRYNPTTSVWSQGTFNYVGCVNGSNDTKYGIGIRFENPNIPQGATINSAYLVVTSAGTYTQDTVNSIIQGEDIDTAVAFSTVANYQARTRTSSYVTWNGIPHWVSGSDYVSSDISTVVSEIVGRAGWTAAVSDMVLFWDDHNAASSQGSYVPPIVRGGSSYKLVVDYTSVTTVTAPDITTKEASDVGSTTAVLNTFIIDDGNDASGAQVTFGYDTITHAGDFSLYGTQTTLTSNYTTGELAVKALTGLTPLTTYFFNAQGRNTAGTFNGTEQQFVTPASTTTLSPSSFIILPSATTVDLQWAKPSGFSESRLYFKSQSIPSSNTTGTLIYSGTDFSYTHSSLTSGTTYGYRVYGYENGVWSASTTGIITTKGTSTTTGLVAPTTPLGWFIDTDYTTQNQTFLYPIINNLADSFSMPRDTAWYTWALGLSMFFGFLVWSASRSMMMVAIAVCAGILLGAAQGILPKATILLILAFAIPIIAVRERI
jgi:hypothetical protein